MMELFLRKELTMFSCQLFLQRASSLMFDMDLNAMHQVYKPLREKCPNGVISGSYFPAFGLNTGEYRKIRTRNNPVFGHFSRRGTCINHKI